MAHCIKRISHANNKNKILQSLHKLSYTVKAINFESCLHFLLLTSNKK